MRAVLVLLLVVGCGGSTTQSHSLVPCDKHDEAARRDLARNALRSRLERTACAGDAACIERVLVERDAYVFERCALPPEGAR